ncbi:MAG: phage head morphogenesis protein [Campylobacteraceae bacterium]|jgi:hypothetical protein|nr:phage head morphogenesis protein [Campylobacteraceae bacterium]
MPPKDTVKFDLQMPFDKALDYFKGKGLKLTYDYKEMMHEAHNKAFTIAKVTRADLLNDMHESLAKAMKEGIGFSEWKKNIKPTLKQYGWYGKVDSVDPKTGEVKEIHVGSRRLKTIYETNIRMSYHNGKYKQAESFEDAVYIQYHSKLLPFSRNSHKKMHGKVMHKDHKFWEKNLPMCDWNCKCFVTWHTKEECEALGLPIITENIPDIAGADFAYDKRTWSYSGNRLTKMDLDKSMDELPTIVPKQKYEERTDEQLKREFFKSLGLGKSGGMFIDKIGDPLTINDELFKTGAGISKIKKMDRHLYLNEFSKVIKNPDEIYLETDNLFSYDEERMYKKHRILKKFFKYYKTKNGDKKALVAMFEYLKDKTQGITLYFIDREVNLNKKRIEKLIYKKN